MGPRSFPLTPKSILLEEGVRIILSGCTAMYVRYPRWGGVQFLGELEHVPGMTHITKDDLHRTGWELLRKADSKRQELLGVAALVGGDYQVLYPTVWSYLTQSRWDDGTERNTSSVTFFTDAGQLKCVLKDKETGYSLWAAGSSLDSMFSVLEALLNDPTAVWRQDKQETGSSARVKKPRG